VRFKKSKSRPAPRGGFLFASVRFVWHWLEKFHGYDFSENISHLRADRYGSQFVLSASRRANGDERGHE
jgi:hypothetical protein